MRARYGLGYFARKHRLPYRLLKPGATVVQIGAPWDLLSVGRSRSMQFSQFVGPMGRVIIIEPDPENVRHLREHISRYAVENVTLIPKGAWNEPGTLRFLSDPDHPAANLVESVFDDARVDRDRFKAIEINVDTLENMLGALQVDEIDLLSLTTNGSELSIINGLGRFTSKTRYLSVVGNRSDFEFLSEIGFEYYDDDDRGYLFVRAQQAQTQEIPQADTKVVSGLPG